MIAVYEDQSGEYDPDDYQPTGLYDDNEWLADVANWSTFYPPGTPEEVIAEQLDGPSAVAVEVTEGSDELIEEIEKGEKPTEASMDLQTDRENDGKTPPWAQPEEKAKDGDDDPSMVGVGGEVTLVDLENVEEIEEDDDVDKDLSISQSNRGFEFIEGSDSGRVAVDSVEEAPDDAVVHATLDGNGEVDGLYYEP